MLDVTHQTVRLSRGKHSGPEVGACVMELASMLAGERFSDHPRSVCPVIAAFLRGYNDGIGDELRQDLYRFASVSVGTRAAAAVRERRIELCRQWVASRRQELRHGLRRLIPGPSIEVHPMASAEEAGAAAATVAAKRVARDAAAHADALRFVERLMAVRIDVREEPLPAATEDFAAAPFTQL